VDLVGCTDVFASAELDEFRSAWLQSFVRHHFQGLRGRLYVYGPESAEAKSRILRAAQLGPSLHVEVVDASSVSRAFREAWAAMRTDDSAAPPYFTEHFVHLFGLQDCLYRARAASARWLLALDVDEVLSFGRVDNMSDFLAWADRSGHEAVSFGSQLRSVSASAGAECASASSDRVFHEDVAGWKMCFPCHEPQQECNAQPPWPLPAGCLGPRGRRKYIVDPSRADALQVHTPMVWGTHHMGHGAQEAQIWHFQGILGDQGSLDLDSGFAGLCEPHACQRWSPTAICEIGADDRSQARSGDVRPRAKGRTRAQQLMRDALQTQSSTV